MNKILLLIFALTMAPSCYFQKNKDQSHWGTEAVAKIEVGVTTRAQVLELLGPPNKIIKLHESEAYLFEHVVEKRTGMFLFILATQRIEKQRDAVTVIIDQRGFVAAVGSKTDAKQASFGSPWGD